MKKIFAAIIFVLSINTCAFADFKQHFDLGQSYLSQYQYSAAVTEFKNALRINYMDNSARIGLINSYLARGAQYANNDKNWTKAADDYRSALFYLIYYPDQGAVNNSAQAISQATSNLDKCLGVLNFSKSFTNRYNSAKKLRAEGNFSAAAYEFAQSLGDKNLQKDSFSQIGDIMNILGNKLKAEEYYKKAVAVAPTDINLRLAYAKILDLNGKYDEALKEYSYVLSQSNSSDKENLYILERTFSKKLSAEPNNANLNANMGAVLQKQEKLDEALTYYKQAENLDPSNINTRINVGTLYQQKGDYRTAIKAYESVLILYPDNVNALLYRAQCYDKLGDTKLAQEGFKKVLAIDPDNSMIKKQMLEHVKKTVSPNEFVVYANTNFKDNNPEDLIYDYAIELHKNNNIDDAIYLYQEAIKASKNTPESAMYINLALAQAQGGYLDNALATLNTASVKFPQDSTLKEQIKNITSMKNDSLISQAGQYYEKADYENAIKTYLSISPATVDSMLGAAGAYQALGNIDNAINYYKKALELKPFDSDIAYYIAVLYGQKDDYTNAKDYLQKSVKFNKNNKNAIQYLASLEEAENSQLLTDAISLYEGNNLDEAFDKLNQILKTDSNNSYALYYRGMIYDAKSKRNEAISDLKRAYELNKDFAICNYLIANNYDNLGNSKEAAKYYNLYALSDVQDDEYKEYAKARVLELNGNVEPKDLQSKK